ncbi:MAG: hypothetical protein L0Y72_00435 [Gemmataceae bacterium]|nr:hypothetical protein [Gemmataceae bacterium]MCI0737477.1 hypothetical protein [Gemmataceae bacterium]
MPVIQPKDDKRYGEILHELCYRIGGTFHAREERTLIVSREQLKALQNAGLVNTNGEQRVTARAKKRK